MKEYGHIEKMETIRVQHEEALKELERVLDFLEGHQAEFVSLVEYYGSDQRRQDLADEEQHLIPSTMKRGVLSEDEIYFLMMDYRDAAIRMLEVAAPMLKV